MIGSTIFDRDPWNFKQHIEKPDILKRQCNRRAIERLSLFPPPLFLSLLQLYHANDAHTRSSRRGEDAGTRRHDVVRLASSFSRLLTACILRTMLSGNRILDPVSPAGMERIGRERRGDGRTDRVIAPPRSPLRIGCIVIRCVTTSNC